MGNQIFPDMEEFMQDLFPLCKYKYVWRPLHYSKQLDVASNTTGSAAKWLPLNSAFFKWLNLAVCLFWKKLFYFMLVRGFASSLVPLLVREIRHLRCASFPFCLSAKEGGGFLHFPPFFFVYVHLFRFSVEHLTTVVNQNVEKEKSAPLVWFIQDDSKWKTAQRFVRAIQFAVVPLMKFKMKQTDVFGSTNLSTGWN